MEEAGWEREEGESKASHAYDLTRFIHDLPLDVVLVTLHPHFYQRYRIDLVLEVGALVFFDNLLLQ